MKHFFKKIAFFSITSFSFITSVLPINNIALSNRETNINKPSKLSISERYKIDEFNYDSGEITKEFSLFNRIDNENRKLLFPFARKFDTNDLSKVIGYYDDTIEIDLKVWKPLGMDDEKFLSETHFDINYFIKNNINDSQNIILNNNINKHSELDSNDKNFDNLLTNKISYIDGKKAVTEHKYISNIILQKGHAHVKIAFDVIHEQSINQNIKDSINRILITPKIIFNIGKNIGPFSIPSQEITLSFINDFFNYNDQLKTLNDYYISDNKVYYLREVPDPTRPTDITNYLQLDTKKGNDTLRISETESDRYNQVPNLQIDTSNFYLDGNELDPLTNKYNHEDDEFEVKIEGVKIDDVKLSITNQNYPENSPKEVVVLSSGQNKSSAMDETKIPDLSIDFKIKDSDFKSMNLGDYKVYDIPIFRNEMITELYDGLSSSNSTRTNLTLKIAVSPHFEDNERIPFKYEVSSMTLEGTSGLCDINKLPSNVNIEAKFMSSNEVVVKTRPLNFSFTKAMNEVLSIQKNEYELESDYTSNVFDKNHILNIDGSNKTTNYDKVYNEVVSNFRNVLINPIGNFIPFGIDTNKPFDLLHQPFVETQYTEANTKHRSKGKMTLKYSPIIENKYFKTLDVIQRVKIKKSVLQNEIVNVEFNSKTLLDFSKGYKNIDTLLNDLNALDDQVKLRYLKLINEDTDDNLINVISKVKFVKSEFNNTIKAKIKLKNPYYKLDEKTHTLISSFEILSPDLKINISFQKVSLSLDEKLIRNKANEAIDYEDFKNKNQDNIKDFILLSYGENKTYDDLVLSTRFVDDKDFKHKVSIEIVLRDEYLFSDNSNTKIFSVANVNWSRENINPKSIDVNLNYDLAAKLFEPYRSIDDFLENNKDLKLQDISSIFSSNNTDNPLEFLDYIYSFKFEKDLNSKNKAKLILQAKEWTYFKFPGSSIKDDTRIFTISNIHWLDEKWIQPTAINVYIDELLFYKAIKEEAENNNEFSFEKFINKNMNSFLIYGNNEDSLIKLDPYDVFSLNAPNIEYSNDGIKINLELTDGFYLKSDNYQNKSTFEYFVDKDLITKWHEESFQESEEKIIDVSFNYNKISSHAKLYNNINQFISSINDEYTLLDYLFINEEDITKIKSISIRKISNISLEVSVEIFPEYYFNDEESNIKIKAFKVSNLVFKNQDKTFEAIDVNIDRQKLFEYSKKFNDVYEMVRYLNNSLTLKDYFDFIKVSNKNSIDAIRFAQLNDKRSIKIIISLKEGYYFKNEPISKLEKEFIFNNLLFKNDPNYNEVFKSASINVNTKAINTLARKLDSFIELKQTLLENNNWENFITSDSIENKPIKKVSVIKLGSNRISLKVLLKEETYFKGEHYSVNEKDFIIGNIFYKNETNTNLKEVEILFNSKKFYKLFQDKQINDWNQFLEVIRPEIMNNTDKYNGILWTNVSIMNFNEIKAEIDNNELVIYLDILDGNYFKGDDISNVSRKITYSSNDLKKFYQEGKQKIENEMFTRDLIIGLSISIPFVITIIAIIIYVLNIKRKKKEDE